MRKRAILLVASMLLSILGAAAPARAQVLPIPGGTSSENVDILGHVPFDAITGTGARLVGKYLYVTSWRNFSIYDVSDPMAPTLVRTVPFGFAFENEDVSTNGNIMLFSESLPRSVLHVWDVEDKSNPTELAALEGAGDHTSTCILNCTYSYGSEGTITDLRDPTNPKIVGDWWKLTNFTDDAHDVEEFKPGFVIVSTISSPLMLMDVRNPLKPKVLARGAHPAPGSWLFHSGLWPNRGKDRFLLMEGEGTNGPFMTYDTRNWRKTRTFKLIDSFTVEGSTASSHWFDDHPDFDNGGLITIGWYGEGTRFLEVKPNGKIKEVGWYEPHVQRSGFSSYWLNKEIVYAIDLYRGIDILRFNRK